MKHLADLAGMPAFDITDSEGHGHSEIRSGQRFDVNAKHHRISSRTGGQWIPAKAATPPAGGMSTHTGFTVGLSAAGRHQLFAAHPLRDHRGDAVTLHRDAVERVSDFHRRLLVGDDDQL